MDLPDFGRRSKGWLASISAKMTGERQSCPSTTAAEGSFTKTMRSHKKIWEAHGVVIADHRVGEAQLHAEAWVSDGETPSILPLYAVNFLSEPGIFPRTQNTM